MLSQVDILHKDKSAKTMTNQKTITDIQGILVGHAQDEGALTGCTVILCPEGATAGVDQRGGAPGTRETDALHPMHLVDKIHGIMLAGGSAFGLDAAGGAVRYLEERGIGFDVGVARVPIVPSAILFDLNIGRADIRPDAAMGYLACLNATSNAPAEGNTGVGCGATVGKILGIQQSMKAGVGSAGVEITPGLIVTALVAVNALGDVIDPDSGQIIAGARLPVAGQQEEFQFADTLQVMLKLAGGTNLGFNRRHDNTVIGVIATNARLTKEQVNKVAQMAQDGLARSIRPAHTMLDGDTIFALATGQVEADVNIIGAFAAQVFAQAIVRAVQMATPAGGLPAIAR